MEKTRVMDFESLGLTHGSDVLVGCCGPAGMRLEDYARRFPVLELQSTFYKLPRVSTAERWKNIAPNLVFTLKAFQGITHPVDSPTWRRSRRELEGVDPADVGLLRVSGFTRRAWDEIERLAGILDAKVVVIQLPPKYDYNSKNLSRLRTFLSAVSTQRIPAVEFRHRSWFGRLQEAREAIAPWGGILVTDPLKVNPPNQTLQYHRMHGSDGLVNYRHKYTDEELQRLGRCVRGKKAYVFFNNFGMKEDAENFLNATGSGHSSQVSRTSYMVQGGAHRTQGSNPHRVGGKGPVSPASFVHEYLSRFMYDSHIWALL